MARTLEVFVPVSVGKKRGKRAGETVLSPPGKFSPMAQRWILFLRASYFRSRYNKVPSFDKTSSHEFPATWENVNTEGMASGDVCGKKRPLRNWRKARGDISSRAENVRKFFLTWETSRCAGRVGLSSFSMRWLEYLTAGFLWRWRYLSYIWRN